MTEDRVPARRRARRPTPVGGRRAASSDGQSRPRLLQRGQPTHAPGQAAVVSSARRGSSPARRRSSRRSAGRTSTPASTTGRGRRSRRCWRSTRRRTTRSSRSGRASRSWAASARRGSTCGWPSRCRPGRRCTARRSPGSRTPRRPTGRTDAESDGRLTPPRISPPGSSSAATRRPGGSPRDSYRSQRARVLALDREVDVRRRPRSRSASMPQRTSSRPEPAAARLAPDADQLAPRPRAARRPRGTCRRRQNADRAGPRSAAGATSRIVDGSKPGRAWTRGPREVDLERRRVVEEDRVERAP